MQAPHTTTAKAIDGIVKGVAQRLGKSGSYVSAMGEGPEKDRYSRFISLWLAVAAEEWEKAEEFYRDFTLRRSALAPKRERPAGEEPRVLAAVNEAVKNVVNGYLSDKPDWEKLRDIAEAEDALRVLSEQIDRRGMGADGLAALQEQRP